MASERFGLERMGLPHEVEEMILASISNEYIRDARSNPVRQALMEELYVWFYGVNLPKELTTINCSNIIITNFDNLPTELVYLNCTNNTIRMPDYFIG